jgi:MFS superfamily sulfate permease-like transporter
MFYRPRYIAHSRNGEAVEAVRALEGRRSATRATAALTLLLVLFMALWGLRMEPGPRQWLIILVLVLVMAWITLHSSVAKKTRAVNRSELSKDVACIDASVRRGYTALVDGDHLNWNDDDLFARQLAVDTAAKRSDEALLRQLRPENKG